MKLYDEKGYANIAEILKQGYVFNFVLGGRGTGKTFSSLKLTLEMGQKIMLMRRTQTQLDIIGKKDFSPYKTLNRILGYNIQPLSAGKNCYIFAECEKDEERDIPISTIAYSCALSTFSNMRGFDASDCELIIYDEFIPEPHEKARIKNEGEAFANAYETISRNRELDGKEPLRVLFLGNANTLNSNILEYFCLIDLIQNMQRKNKKVYKDDEKSIFVALLDDSPISKKKSVTALYKAVSGDFVDMAINNSFRENNDNTIKSKNIKGYSPLFSTNGVYVYRHKSNGSFYVTYHMAGDFRFITAEKARSEFRWLYFYYISKCVFFSSFEVKKKLTNVMKWDII